MCTSSIICHIPSAYIHPFTHSLSDLSPLILLPGPEKKRMCAVVPFQNRNHWHMCKFKHINIRFFNQSFVACINFAMNAFPLKIACDVHISMVMSMPVMRTRVYSNFNHRHHCSWPCYFCLWVLLLRLMPFPVTTMNRFGRSIWPFSNICINNYSQDDFIQFALHYTRRFFLEATIHRSQYRYNFSIRLLCFLSSVIIRSRKDLPLAPREYYIVFSATSIIAYIGLATRFVYRHIFTRISLKWQPPPKILPEYEDLTRLNCIHIHIKDTFIQSRSIPKVNNGARCRENETRERESKNKNREKKIHTLTKWIRRL